MKVSISIFSVLLIIFSVFIIYVNAHNEYLEKINRPAWQFPGKNPMVPGQIMSVKEAGNDLILIKKVPYSSLVLFKNYKNQFNDIKLYIKDINQDGEIEIICTATDKRNEKKVYIVSQLKLKSVKVTLTDIKLWTAEKILFDEDERIYKRSCGSQYCNDTYYIWDGHKLIERYTNTYESM